MVVARIAAEAVIKLVEVILGSLRIVRTYPIVSLDRANHVEASHKCIANMLALLMRSDSSL